MLNALFKILVVDDSTENLKLLGNNLKKHGYNILTATNGKQAIALAETKKPNLILLDIMMPEINGFEVCEALKSNVSTHNIPVIFVSALNQTNDLNNAISIGANDYIQKPINTEELYFKVRNQLEISQRINFERQSVTIYKKLISGNYNTIFSEQNQKTDSRYNENTQLVNYFADLSYPSFNHDKFTIQLFINFLRSVGINNQLIQVPERTDQIDFIGFYLLKLTFDLLIHKFKFEKSEIFIKESAETPIQFQLEVTLFNLVSLDEKNPLLNALKTQNSSDNNDLFLELLQLLNINHQFIHSDQGIDDITFSIPLNRGYYISENENKSNLNDKGKILIIEDNQLNSEFLSIIISELGYNFDIVENGEDALKQITSHEFDFIFSDLNLPDKSGEELLNEIKNTVGLKCPIIAISGHSDDLIINRCLDAGFSDYLVKPFIPSDIEKLILKHNNNNQVKTQTVEKAFNFEKAIELSGNNPELFNEWLQNFIKILTESIKITESMLAAGKFTSGNKSYHDLRNYSSYFEIYNIIQYLNTLQINSDQDLNVQTLEKLLNELQKAKSFYNAQLK